MVSTIKVEGRDTEIPRCEKCDAELSLCQDGSAWPSNWRCTRCDDKPHSADSRQVGGTHYIEQLIQPWDIMHAYMSKEQLVGYFWGNAIKYILRFPKKGGKQDLDKASHYLEKLKEVI